MSRTIVRAALAISLLAGTACTQTPAQVDLKGQYFFGHNGQQERNQRSYAYAPPSSLSNLTPASGGSNTYATQTPATGPTEQTASVQSIGVSDLAPPPAKTSAVEPSPVSKWSAAEQKPIVQATHLAKNESLKPENHGKPVQLIKEPRESAFIWPVNSKKIVSGFGPKGSGKANDGINIASAEGEPVWATADGEVIYVGNELSGYGNMVIIKHAGDRNTTYAHLNQATVDKYDRVKQGDIIGYVGSTGNVNTPQLHFAVREGKNPVDPQAFLSRSVAGL